MSPEARFRLDDLRRLSIALVSAAGLTRPDAATLAAHLLWYDAAGAASFGIARLPGWLDELTEAGSRSDTSGAICAETATTAILDGAGGLAPLVLAEAATVAARKARELGIGLCRVTGLPARGSAAAVAAQVALGPLAAVVIGPGPSWTVALPTAGELPFVFDSELSSADGRPGNPTPTLPAWLATLAPPSGGWLLAVLAISALEPLAGFHERLMAAIEGDSSPGTLRPDAWEAHRRGIREHGVPLDAATVAALRGHAERSGVSFPEPMTPR